jgi:Rap1a immunity proteins
MNKKMWALFLIPLTCIFSNRANATYPNIKGIQLIQYCNLNNINADKAKWNARTLFADGVITGSIDQSITDAINEKFELAPTKAATHAATRFCIPAHDYTMFDIGVIVSKYLSAHTQLLNQDADELVIWAFEGAWPCPK